MNKKEIAEIKKCCTLERACVEKVCGCYVNAEREKVLLNKELVMAMPEEEAVKYLEIARKALTGNIGKALFNLAFPLDEEQEGGAQHAMMGILGTKTDDYAMMEEFYDRIIHAYTGDADEYYIITFYGAYAVASAKSRDHETEESQAPNMYRFMLTCICPVSLTNAGLCYDPDANTVGDADRLKVISKPAHAFLFPAFNGRTADIHEVLYYTASKPEAGIVEGVLGCTTPFGAAEEKSMFAQVIDASLKDQYNYDIACGLQDELNSLIEEHKDSGSPLSLDKHDLTKIMENVGLEDESAERFADEFDAVIGEKATLMAEHITDEKKMEIVTSEAAIKIDAKRSDIVSIDEHNGRKCVIIELSDPVSVNGIRVSY